MTILGLYCIGDGLHVGPVRLDAAVFDRAEVQREGNRHQDGQDQGDDEQFDERETASVAANGIGANHGTELLLVRVFPAARPER